ncbi:hypothetical protein UlMin_007446, partial [Ulmus minor]
KCIINIMDFVSVSASQNSGLLREFYQTTLKALEEGKNERLWFKTDLKLCQIWFNMQEYGRMSKILKELHESCQKEDGTDDQKKGSQLLEVYAIEIHMCTETKNNKTLEAATDFFEAFKNYMMKLRTKGVYNVLTNMLMESEVNPFSRKLKYKNDPEISTMKNLIAAYQKNEILDFEKILRELNVPEKDVEQLLVSLILDITKLMDISIKLKGMKKHAAIDKWYIQLKSLYQTIGNRVY